MNYYVYILSNVTNTVVYTGVTNNIERRIYEHKNRLNPDCFTAKYGVHKLVYFESTINITAAIEREKQIKSWKRKRKNKLVSDFNPEWKDLYPILSHCVTCHCEERSDVAIRPLNGITDSHTSVPTGSE